MPNPTPILVFVVADVELEDIILSRTINVAKDVVSLNGDYLP